MCVRQPPVRAGAGDHLSLDAPFVDADVEVAALEEQRNASRCPVADHDGLDLGVLCGRDGEAATNDGRLLAGDGREGRAEVGLVVAIDAGQHGHGRDADRRRVEPATHPDLEDRDVHGLAREVVEGERRGRFEHRRVETGDERAQRVHAVHHGVRRDRLAVHTDPLAKGDQVGRGVEADTATGRLQHRGQQGRGRALAVGAADLRDRESLFGMAKRGQ